MCRLDTSLHCLFNDFQGFVLPLDVNREVLYGTDLHLMTLC